MKSKALLLFAFALLMLLIAACAAPPVPTTAPMPIPTTSKPVATAVPTPKATTAPTVKPAPTQPVPVLNVEALSSNLLRVGVQPLYRWTIKAPPNGMAWLSVQFQISGKIHTEPSKTMSVGTKIDVLGDGVYLFNENGDQSKILEVNSLKITNLTTGLTVAGYWHFSHSLTEAEILFNAGEEQQISANGIVRYELTGNLLYGGIAGSGDALKINIPAGMAEKPPFPAHCLFRQECLSSSGASSTSRTIGVTKPD